MSLNFHPKSPAQIDAYNRYADLLRMYAGPILEEGTAFGHFTQEQRQTIHEDCQQYGIRVVIELVDKEQENPVIKPIDPQQWAG